ncbi:MAG: sensor histidine kinase [Paracoccus sp. (in: a-proteobacteria)]
MLKRDIPGLEQIVHDLAEDPAIHQVMILNPERQIRFASDPGLVGQALPITGEAPPPGVMRAEQPVPNRAACADCHGSAADHPVNGILVVDQMTGDLHREAMTGAAGLIALGAIATLAASIALALGLRRIVVRPVTALSQAVDALSRGDLSARVEVRGQDEIAALGQGLNRMAENIEQGQEALMRAERMSQALIDAIPDGIRVIGPDFRIRRANAAYSAQTGRLLPEIVGQYCYASSHGRTEPCPYTLVTCPIAEMRKEPRPLTFRDRHQAPAGRQIAVEISAAPMDDSVVEAIRDLDEQARVSQAQRLSEIGLLATGVAHEIHNPLSSVELALSTLTRDLKAGRSDRLQDYFALIRGEIGKCLEITDNLLRLSGPANQSTQLINLMRATTGAMQLLQYEAENLGIAITVEIPDDLRALIAESDLRMAITNLAMNAFHAMPKGGSLTLRGRREGGRILLEIEDSGVGIAAEDLHDIFMPFWSRRADTSNGRGLGLAITRAITDRANAAISVDSTPGRGSRFTISFPDPDTDSAP